MENEPVMEINLEQAIQTLMEAYAKLSREFNMMRDAMQQRDANIARQFAERDARITVLTALVDQHQLRLEGRKTGGGFNA
jgi:archaellum component FlaC